MKAIMISIQTKWVAKILNGEKTIEIRKTMPKDFEGWVYIYCTKGKSEKDRMFSMREGFCIELNGLVVARFYLKKVRKYTENDTIRSEIIKDTCLTSQEIWQYAKGKPIYLWHIDNLEIFDEPKELNKFIRKVYHRGFWLRTLEKAPQSWGYIEL